MGKANNTIGETLQRIVILLFSLAGLADCAACAPADKRRRALAFIYRGESAAWGLLADGLQDDEKPKATRSLGSTIESSGLAAQIYTDDSPQAALLLAARLRMLGWIIANLLQLSDDRDKPAHRPGLQALLPSLCGFGAAQSAGLGTHPDYLDTS